MGLPTAVTVFSIAKLKWVHGKHMLQNKSHSWLSMTSDSIRVGVTKHKTQKLDNIISGIMTHLPQMTNDWSIGPGVLSIQTHGAILKNDQVKGFIKPPE